MIALDDKEFARNTIIDLVLLPDMSTHAVLNELIDPTEFKILIDTQGNLHQFYSLEYGQVAGDKARSNRTLNMSFLHNMAECESDESYITDYASFICEEDNADICRAEAGPAERNFTESTGDTATSSEATDTSNMPVALTPTVDHSSEEDRVSLLSDWVSSSLEYSLCKNDKYKEAPGVTLYYFTSGFHKFLARLKEISRHRSFVLVIDTITFVCDCAPYNLQYVINILWNLIYECDATIITINHYRLGCIEQAYKLIPRMGALWEYFVDYQVLLGYRNKSIIFTVKKDLIRK